MPKFKSSDTRPRRRRERGAAMVEAAIAIPLLLLLMFGTLEAGMAWEAKSSATSGLRTGILRAVSLGNEPETDLLVLQSIVGEVGAERIASLEYVIIFDADGGATPDAVIANCQANTIPVSANAAAGINGLCVIYGPGHLSGIVDGTITLSNFDDGTNATAAGNYNCDTSTSPDVKIDRFYCAGDRVTVNQTSRNLGVYIKYDHKWFTGVLPGDGVEFSDYAVSSTLLGDQAP